jgi:NADP-dependent 3-hydroxy acid dehydrogenase YdfG
MRPLKEKTAVVTGATSGIGQAVALGLASQGTNLCLVGRRQEELESVAQRIRLYNLRVLTDKADLTRDEDIRAIATRLRREFGSIDILVHSAGVISLGPLETAPVEALDLQYRTNLRAPYLLTQALLPLLEERRGHIVFINSIVAGRAGVSQYAATKHALKTIADSLREEVHPKHIQVMSVFAGRTATPMQACIHEEEGRVYNPELLLQPEDVAAVVINALSLPCTAEVTEIQIRPFNRP